jgi:hypothetical protein
MDGRPVARSLVESPFEALPGVRKALRRWANFGIMSQSLYSLLNVGGSSLFMSPRLGRQRAARDRGWPSLKEGFQTVFGLVSNYLAM